MPGGPVACYESLKSACTSQMTSSAVEILAGGGDHLRSMEDPSSCWKNHLRQHLKKKVIPAAYNSVPGKWLVRKYG